MEPCGTPQEMFKRMRKLYHLSWRKEGLNLNTNNMCEMVQEYKSTVLREQSEVGTAGKSSFKYCKS